MKCSAVHHLSRREAKEHSFHCTLLAGCSHGLSSLGESGKENEPGINQFCATYNLSVAHDNNGFCTLFWDTAS